MIGEDFWRTSEARQKLMDNFNIILKVHCLCPNQVLFNYTKGWLSSKEKVNRSVSSVGRRLLQIL
jgi:hypothetical protein